MELLIGAGSRRDRALSPAGKPSWTKLVTLDFNADHNPDVVHDLRDLPLPFPDNSFDEIHAYEVLEHTGRQGDVDFFFRQWSDFWRLLKPDGVFLGTSPAVTSPWLWGDPGHTRAIQPETLVFLDQAQYEEQVGKTPMTDYRYLYHADFTREFVQINGQIFAYALKAIKPSRWKGKVI